MSRRLFSYPLSLAVVVATLIAATGGWIAWWNYHAGKRNIRTLASGLFDQVAGQTAAATEGYLRRAPPAAETLAGVVALDHPQTSSDVMAKRCAAVLRANAGIAWVSYGDRHGTFVGAFRAGDEIHIKRSAIAQATGRALVVEHALADDGSLVQVKQEETDYDPRKRPFFRLAVKAGKGVWTPPYVFAESVPGISYALPVFEGRALAGVLTIDFELAGLSDLARALQFSPHGHVVIVSDEDVVVAHPTARVIVTVDGTPQLVAARELSDPALDAALAARGSEVDVAGTTYLTRTLPIELPGGAPWRVVAFAPEADFTAGVGRRALSSLLISLAAVLISIVVAWVLARRISRPLTYVAAEMAKVGELRIEPGEHAPSMFREIEMMTTALARMKGGLRSFASYVPHDLVRAVLASGQDARLSGDVRELTVYFSDLAGFTAFAETRKPDELVRVLGEYFDDMSKIIADEQGTLDKYLGDGIMAFWGAPLPVPDHAARACVAALLSQRRLTALRPGGVPLRARIGIATGDVLVGNIGSTERLNYTVMGDTANLAARLESLNKQYGTSVMIDHATYEQAKSVVVARALDVVAVKGKQHGVRIYEVLALVADGDAEAEAIAQHSAAALDAYLARRFDDAVAEWTQVLARLPNDTCAVMLRDRATALAARPPGAAWDGVTAVTEK